LGAALEMDGTWYVGPSVNTSTNNTGAGTVNAANGYFLGGVNISPGHTPAGQSTPANPGGTTSTTFVMMGLAGSITPTVSGRVLLAVSGDARNSVAGDGGTISFRTGTGNVPTNGQAGFGNSLGNAVSFTSTAANAAHPFSIVSITTGLTLNTAHWIDVALLAVTGGTASIEGVTIVAMEF
jgi:hypothetical protein